MSIAQLKRLLSAVFVSAVLAIPVVGCQTIEGAGRDVQEAGEAVEESARETRPY